MDRLNIREKLPQLLKKHRYAVIVLAVGLILMLLPISTQQEAEPQPQQTVALKEEDDLAQKLQQILSQIRGAGKVQVLLTQAKGEQVIFQTDEDRGSDGSLRVETVIVTDQSKNQTGLIRQIESPVYLGAVVVCQGADQAAVRLAIVEAVGNATGLGADKISVITMK